MVSLEEIREKNKETPWNIAEDWKWELERRRIQMEMYGIYGMFITGFIITAFLFWWGYFR